MVCSLYDSAYYGGEAFSFFRLGRSLYELDPRPYQTWAIQPLIKKDSLGKSFPSRHVFSATVIAMLALTLNPWLGGAMLFLAMALVFFARARWCSLS